MRPLVHSLQVQREGGSHNGPVCEVLGQWERGCTLITTWLKLSFNFRKSLSGGKAGEKYSLLLDSRVLRDQELNERRQQRFASLADVVHELEESQVDREFLCVIPTGVRDM
jgi:hypothetical protein